MALGDQPALVLSEVQQKKSIAGLKVQKRKVVHTLDSPVDIQWPKIGFERENEARKLLSDHLCAIRSKNISIPLKTLSAVPREERAKLRKGEREKLQQVSPVNKNQMSHCVVGMRDVLKAIEKKQACIVLCEGYPTQIKSMLTKLLIPLCRRHNIPLLPMKNFTSTLTKVLNVPNCLTVALKTAVKEAHSPLHQLYLGLEGVSNSCGLITASCDKIEKEETTTEEKQEEIENNNEGGVQIEQQTVDCERFYLKKPAQGRCFVPGNVNPLRNVEETSSEVKGFISVANISGYAPVKVPSRYHADIRIKRLQPNANKAVSKSIKKE